MDIRPARPEDYEAFARLFVELGTADAPPSARGWVETMVPQTIVAEEDGTVAGYVFAQLLHDVGYVRNVVVDPRYRRRGLGRRLLLHVRDRVRAAGHRHWCLNVRPDNIAALALYESLGMSPSHTAHTMQMPWTIIERLPSPPDVEVAPLECSDESRIEQQFGMYGGILAHYRSRGVHLVVARRDSVPTGVAGLRRERRRARPVCAVDLETMRALLVSLRMEFDANADTVQLVLEDAPSLVTELEKRGATRALEVLHFVGQIEDG